MSTAPTDSLTLTHSSSEGTLCDGTAKDDGTAPILTGHGWRWSRTLGMWYLPRSREHAPKRHIIEATAAALRKHGHEVNVTIDATPDDPAVVAQRRAERARDRAAHHDAAAERAQQRADAREAAAERMVSAIPAGQPILVGHHSQRRAERDRDRIAAHLDAAVMHEREAHTHREAADRARHDTAGPSPLAVARRIARLEAEVRKLERQAARHSEGSPAWTHLHEHLMHQRTDLEHLRTIRAAHIADGRAVDYGPHVVRPGDAVQIRGTWRRVVRANRATVAVASGYSWTDKAPWHEVTAHRSHQG